MLFEPANLPDKKWLKLSEVVDFLIFGETCDVNVTLEASSPLNRAYACKIQELLQQCPDKTHPEYSPSTLRRLQAAREQIGAWFASGKVVFEGHRLDEKGQEMCLERILPDRLDEVGIYWENDFIAAFPRDATNAIPRPGTSRTQRIRENVCVQRDSLVNYLTGGPSETEVASDKSSSAEQLPDAFVLDVDTSAPATATKGAPPKFPWPAFLAEVEDKMRFRGDFDPSLEVKWNQAALERHMKEWAIATWGCAPGKTRLRTKVKEGVARFRAGFGQ